MPKYEIKEPSDNITGLNLIILIIMICFAVWGILSALLQAGDNFITL